MNKHTTAYRCKQEIWDALKKISEKEDRSINWLLNHGAKKLIKDYEKNENLDLL